MPLAAALLDAPNAPALLVPGIPEAGDMPGITPGVPPGEGIGDVPPGPALPPLPDVEREEEEFVPFGVALLAPGADPPFVACICASWAAAGFALMPGAPPADVEVPAADEEEDDEFDVEG